MYGRAKKFAGRMGGIWRLRLRPNICLASYTTGHEFTAAFLRRLATVRLRTFGSSIIVIRRISASRGMSFIRQGMCGGTCARRCRWRGCCPRSAMRAALLLRRRVRGQSHRRTHEVPRCGGDFRHRRRRHRRQHSASLRRLALRLLGLCQPLEPLLHGSPTLPLYLEIQSRLAYVSSIDALERAKKIPGCLYMRPPIDPFGTLESLSLTRFIRSGINMGTSSWIG